MNMIGNGLTGATLVGPPGVPHTRIVGLGNCTRPAKQRPEIGQQRFELLSAVYIIHIISNTNISYICKSPHKKSICIANRHFAVNLLQFMNKHFYRNFTLFVDLI